MSEIVDAIVVELHVREAQPECADYPALFRVGAYAFFALCAFGVGLVAYAAAKACGLSDSLQTASAYLANIAVFLALRDMTKRHDRGPSA